MSWSNKEKQREYLKQYRIKNKESLKEKKRLYDQKNRSKVRERMNTWRAKNKDKVNQKSREYYAAHIEEQRLRSKLKHIKFKEKNNFRNRIYRRIPEVKLKEKLRKEKYRELNREKISKKHADYYLKNRERILKRNADWDKKAYKTNLQFAIRKRLRARLLDAFEYFTKNGKVYFAKDYGIDYSAIVKHLISTKPKDLDTQEYHIDHIIPLAKFDLTNKEQVKICCSPENLQWLPAKENESKSDKVFSRPEVLQYI
jgi:hypothetical protein